MKIFSIVKMLIISQEIIFKKQNTRKKLGKGGTYFLIYCPIIGISFWHFGHFLSGVTKYLITSKT
jgi:hypothetical protein